MKILLASSIDPGAVEVLEREHDVVRAFNAPEGPLAELVEDREVVIFRSGVTISAAVLDRAPNLVARKGNAHRGALHARNGFSRMKPSVV